jgi:hypothetical protein
VSISASGSDPRKDKMWRLIQLKEVIQVERNGEKCDVRAAAGTFG